MPLIPDSQLAQHLALRTDDVLRLREQLRRSAAENERLTDENDDLIRKGARLERERNIARADRDALSSLLGEERRTSEALRRNVNWPEGTRLERLASFVFLLARDHVGFGIVEDTLDRLEGREPDAGVKYVGVARPLGDWARTAALRLVPRDDPPA